MIGETFPTFMLAQKHNFGYPIVKSHSCMFPVTYMVTKPEGENAVSKIIAVKEEPEGIDNPLAFLNNYKNRWC
jgi:hypothetical protein